MTLFMLIAALMLLAALAFVIFPLLRASRGAEPDHETLTVLADSIRELDAERASGSLSPAEYEASRRELERQALEADIVLAERRHVDRRAGWSVALIAGIALPLLAVVVYVGVGQPSAILASSSDARAGVDHERVDDAIVALSRRLKTNGNDGAGWVLLARAYLAGNRAADALAAYRKATVLLPDDAAVLVEYANTLAIANNRNLTGEPEELVERALEIEPDNLNALALAGVVAMQHGNRPLALTHWTRLQRLLDPASEDGRRIAELVARASGDAPDTAPMKQVEAAKPTGSAAAHPDGVTTTQRVPAEHPVGVTPTGPGTTAAAAPASASASASAVADAGVGGGGGGGGEIRGTVTIASELASKVAPGDTLFVFAKAANGPPMPVAVMRTRAGEWPVQFRLDDSSAMVAGMTLSSFPRVDIVARVSRRGSADSQPGDIEGHLANVSSGSTGVHVVMDSVVGR